MGRVWMPGTVGEVLAATGLVIPRIIIGRNVLPVVAEQVLSWLGNVTDQRDDIERAIDISRNDGRRVQVRPLRVRSLIGDGGADALDLSVGIVDLDANRIEMMTAKVQGNGLFRMASHPE